MREVENASRGGINNPRTIISNKIENTFENNTTVSLSFPCHHLSPLQTNFGLHEYDTPAPKPSYDGLAWATVNNFAEICLELELSRVPNGEICPVGTEICTTRCTKRAMP